METDTSQSISGLSDSRTDPSVGSEHLGPSEIRLLRHAFIPWDAHGEGKLAVKLGLYFLYLLAVDNHDLEIDYPPLSSVHAQSRTRPSPLGRGLSASRMAIMSVGASSPPSVNSSPRASDQGNSGPPNLQRIVDVGKLTLVLILGNQYYSYNMNGVPGSKLAIEWEKMGEYLVHSGEQLRGKL